MANLYLVLKNHFELPDPIIEDVLNSTNSRTLEKKECFLRCGVVPSEIAFIESGSLVISHIDDEEEYAIDFAFENMWVTDDRCFFEEVPTDLDIYALEHTEVQTLSKHAYNKLLEKHYELLSIREQYMRKVYYKMSAHAKCLISKKAEDRYLDTISRRPELLQVASMKLLASYLGITPQSLSRVRRGLMNR